VSVLKSPKSRKRDGKKTRSPEFFWEKGKIGKKKKTARPVPRCPSRGEKKKKCREEKKKPRAPEKGRKRKHGLVVYYPGGGGEKNLPSRRGGG